MIAPGKPTRIGKEKPEMILITPSALDEIRETVRVCDVRWYLGEPDRGQTEFDKGHIPGSVFVEVDRMLSGPSGPGRHPLPSVDQFANDLGRMGISPETMVVVYDNSGGGIAARMWWMLRSIGHEAVSVLDGGWDAWPADGRAISTEVSIPTAVVYPAPIGWTGVADRNMVVAHQGVLVDARAAERYRGEVEPIDPRPGHIPGAVNLPHLGNLDESGSHRGRDELRARFSEVGTAPIVYCGSGITACHNLLAMSIAGIEGGMLYEGSWSDWAAQPHLPSETGA